MSSSKSWTEFALLTLVLPLGCARILGFEQASLDPEGNRVSARLNGDAGDGGGAPSAAYPEPEPEPDAGEPLGHGSHDSMPHATTEPDAGNTVELGEGGEDIEQGDAGVTTSDGAASAADAAAEDGPLPLDCQTFCDVALDACPRAETESVAVYDSTFTCLRQCGAYAVGTPGDDSGNTLACRMTHALIARDFPGERANSCPAAGPGGNGVCGSNCEGYCNLMLQTCDTFTTDDECQSACREVPDLGGFEVSQNEGNSVQCRLYHLGAALASPTFHCPHASGESPCAETLALPLP